MLSGGLVVIVWKQISGGIFDIYEIVPGFVISSLCIIIFSMVGGKPSREQQNCFDKAVEKNQGSVLS